MHDARGLENPARAAFELREPLAHLRKTGARGFDLCVVARMAFERERARADRLRGVVEELDIGRIAGAFARGGVALADQLAGDLYGRTAVLVDGVFEVILQLVKTLDGERVLGAVDADGAQPLGVDGEPAGRLADRFTEGLLVEKVPNPFTPSVP